METLLAICVGLGFASVAGVRTFLPLFTVLMIVIFAGFGNPPFLYMQINNLLSLPVLVALIAFLLLECALDIFTTLERPLNWAMVPVRAAAGAAVFAVVERDPPGLLGPMSAFYFVKLPDGVSILAPYLIAGAVVAGFVAVAKAMFRPSASTSSAGVSSITLSSIEDLMALLGSLLAAPYL